MRVPLLLLSVSLAVTYLACSTGSTHGTSVTDGGAEAAPEAGDDACFPFCSSSSGAGSGSGGMGDDGGTADASCAQLKAQIESLQGPAQACDPTKLMQCGGTAEGICCPITVTAGNDVAVNNFQQTVDTYKSTCDAGCLTPVCPTAPSMVCQPGSPGTCQ